MRVQVYLSKGSEINFPEIKEIRLTPATIVVYGEMREGIDLLPPVLGEFYREAVAGWKRTDV